MKRVETQAQGLELEAPFLRHVQERKAQFKKGKQESERKGELLKGETQCFVSISLLQFVPPLLLSRRRLRQPPPRLGVTKMYPRLWYPRRQRAEKYFKSVIYSHSRTPHISRWTPTSHRSRLKASRWSRLPRNCVP